MKKGWIKIHRSCEDNDLYFLEPFTKRQAWQDLILTANHKDGKIIVRGNVIEIKRGQNGYAEKTLAQRRKWSRGKVRRFLGTLKTGQQIVQQKNKIKSIITIVNYEKYQGKKQETGQQTVQQTDTNNNGNNDKNKYIVASDVDFLVFCELVKRELSQLVDEDESGLGSVEDVAKALKDWSGYKSMNWGQVCALVDTMKFRKVRTYRNYALSLQNSIANGWKNVVQWNQGKQKAKEEAKEAKKLKKIPEWDDDEAWLDLFDKIDKKGITAKKWWEENMNKDRDMFYQKKMLWIDKVTFNQ